MEGAGERIAVIGSAVSNIEIKLPDFDGNLITNTTDVQAVGVIIPVQVAGYFPIMHFAEEFPACCGI